MFKTYIFTYILVIFVVHVYEVEETQYAFSSTEIFSTLIYCSACLTLPIPASGSKYGKQDLSCVTSICSSLCFVLLTGCFFLVTKDGFFGYSAVINSTFLELVKPGHIILNHLTCSSSSLIGSFGAYLSQR